MGRVLAVGDIHGCLSALDTLLGAVRLTAADTLVTLGDYVDRGPDSRGVLDRLLELSGTHHLVPLRGNHDIVLCAVQDGSRSYDDWLLSYRGDKTVESYGGHLSFVPERHWQFLRDGLLPYYESDTHLFVHASLLPDYALDEQPDWALYWGRFGEQGPHPSGKTIVCGHTSQKDGMPRSFGHSVCIDTWACGGQWLTCLDCGSGLLVQANQRGETRRLWADELDPPAYGSL